MDKKNHNKEETINNYKKMVEQLGGQYIKISPASTGRINPLDLSFSSNDLENDNNEKAEE